MAWYEKVLGLEDKDKRQEELDDMYNAAGTTQQPTEQQVEEEKVEAVAPARAERKRAGEDVSGEQHDHTDPLKQRVGVVPDDIANHDSNKGTENDNVESEPTTTGGTQNGNTYSTLEDIAKVFQTRADEEEKESRVDEAELRRTAKRRMLLAGIADAANSFHQAYAYARGIKAMNDNKGYAKEVRKELRDDLDWLRKNKDRVLNYRAKAAEIQKTIAALKKQDVETEYKWKNLERLNAEHQRLVDKDYDARMKDEWKRDIEQGKLDVQKRRLEIEEDYKRGLISLRQREISIKELNALGKVVTKEKVDPLTGETTIETTTTKPVGTGNAAGGTSGNSNAGTSKGSEDNTPPSKRPQKNNDSTPPSRRK